MQTTWEYGITVFIGSLAGINLEIVRNVTIITGHAYTTKSQYTMFYQKLPILLLN